MADAAAARHQEDDDFPLVAAPTAGNGGLIVFLVILALGGAGLFAALNANRLAQQQPGILDLPPEPGARIASPPPVEVPPALLARGPLARADEGPVLLRRIGPVPQTPVSIVRAAPPAPQPAPPRQAPLPAGETPPYLRPAPEPAVVYRDPPPVLPPPAPVGSTAQERVMAVRFDSPAFTVPKGTIIPAVLETAFDSTQPGGVRALVQRPVPGFDGSRVLIPRGSRLIGEYEASLQGGQKRALIQWTRLIRPDGAVIALDSPSSDPLGRAGVRGKVDSKFLQRFGSAILQSILDIGVGVATRRVSDGVIVALPGSTAGISPVRGPQDIQPTLRVPHGTSVSVFVARDLDFSTVDQ